MYIKELIIEEFAGAVNQRILLDQAFNLITGANESGKSTVCAFIKFILYGFTDTKEKSRHSSLKTKNSEGAMIIVQGNKTYRIARKASGRIQDVKVYDEQDGSEFNGWRTTAETPGEYFLGITPALYTRSLYVSQAEGAALDGGSAEAISNLLLTGDEALNLKKAKKTLDEARRALKLRRGVGGLIAECEGKLADLNAKRRNALEARRQLEAVSIALQRERQNAAILKAEIERASEAMRLLKAKKLMGYLNELDRLTDEQSKNKIITDDLIKTNTFGTFIPSEEYERQLSSAIREASMYADQVKNAEDRLTELQARLHATPPKEYDAYCAAGKKETLLPPYNKASSRCKATKLLSIIFALLLIVTGIFIPILLPISGACTVIFAVLFFLSNKKISALNASLGADRVRTLLDICRDCDAYEQKISTSDLGYLSAILDENKANAKSAKEKLSALLAYWGKTSAEQALADYHAFSSKLSVLRKENQRITNDISVVNAHLSGYSENDIAQARALPTDTVFPADGEISELQLQSLKNRLTDSERQCSEHEIALAGTATQADLEALSAEIEATEARLADYNLKYDAISLALEALDASETNIRKTVSPYLSEHSSEYFARITKGKYTELRLNSDMELSYISVQTAHPTDSAYFSTGSADLAWLCLRLALHEKLTENTVIPIILDEALVYFDDDRLKLILEELVNIAGEGVQVILFSASSREKALLPKGINHITLCQKR